MLDDERGDPLGTGGAIGNRHHHHDVPEPPWVMKVFEPFKPTRRRAGRGRAHAGRVTARRGFGETPGAQFLAFGERHQPALLLRLGAEQENVRGAQSIVRSD